MSEALVEIPRSDWVKLRELYTHRDTDPLGYPCINNFIQWVEKDPSLKVKFLSLNGDWQKDGTFILTWHRDVGLNHLYFNTLSENLDTITKALEVLKPLENEYIFFGFASRFKPVVEHIGKKFYTKELFVVGTVWYKASKELVDTFTFEVPPGLTLGNLSVKDAETINEIWPHRAPGSVHFVRNLIQLNVNTGAYDENGKLVAWCLRLPIGSLGLLQVLDSHKRMGLGQLMVKSLSKKISALGDQVLSPVVHKNTASRNMFEKIGFQAIDTVYWAD
ncbi:uncharacterized protein [Drosophila kikkawai]|uniref:N-acetyltransferase domain-containing protein n=1 Tax=Drosophila kikkawai TaxID=30033 RepID=A0A6P4IT71_DROKI|nr:uncharacterized protein LOC108077039 [Drosophila kikkawai]